MSHITLIRHGQANTHAKDEASYDKLSDLGHQQARWLGEYLTQTQAHYTRVYCGTLRRHIETAQSLGADRYGEIVQDARLNEFGYFSLELAMFEQKGLARPTSREEFARHMPQTFAAWMHDELDGLPESFADFNARISAAIAEILEGSGPALVVTSAGVISTVMRNTLKLEEESWARMCLAIYNSSMHNVQSFMDAPLLTQFNGIPHLDPRDRHYAQTHL